MQTINRRFRPCRYLWFRKKLLLVLRLQQSTCPPWELEKCPPLSSLLTIVQAKLSLLPKYGDPGETQKFAHAIVTNAIKREGVRLLG